MLGIGPEGHVASIFPDSPAAHADGTVVAVRNSPKPPPTRISLTFGALQAAREVWVLASGAEKAEAVAVALSGVSQVELPAAGARGTRAHAVPARRGGGGEAARGRSPAGEGQPRACRAARAHGTRCVPVTICGLPDRHRGAAAATGATLAWEATTMRYALLMHYREPGDGEISEEAIEEAKEAFGAYGRALESAGVLLSADVLQPSAATTTVTCRDGGLRVQDGPFAETKEALAGIFLLDVPDLDAAIGWAEKCPGAQWGVIEVRPTATAFVDGAWTR